MTGYGGQAGVGLGPHVGQALGQHLWGIFYACEG